MSNAVYCAMMQGVVLSNVLSNAASSCSLHCAMRREVFCVLGNASRILDLHRAIQTPFVLCFLQQYFCALCSSALLSYDDPQYS